jgi:hypothetical protein
MAPESRNSPLLDNGSVNTFPWQRVDAKTEEKVVSIRFPSKLQKESTVVKTPVEAGTNTSTVTLRVVGGDEKGSLKSETVKYGRESQETRT